jgi:hypothetical protein
MAMICETGFLVEKAKFKIFIFVIFLKEGSHLQIA